MGIKYKRTYWVDEDLRDMSGTPVNAENMNKIESIIPEIEKDSYNVSSDIDTIKALVGPRRNILDRTLSEVGDYIDEEIQLIRDFSIVLDNNKKGESVFIKDTGISSTDEIKIEAVSYQNIFNKCIGLDNNSNVYNFELFGNLIDNIFSLKMNTIGLKQFTPYTLFLFIRIPKELQGKGDLIVFNSTSSYYKPYTSKVISLNKDFMLIKETFTIQKVNTGAINGNDIQVDIKYPRANIKKDMLNKPISVVKPLILQGEVENIPCSEYYDSFFKTNSNIDIYTSNGTLKVFKKKDAKEFSDRFEIYPELYSENDVRLYNGTERVIELENDFIYDNTPIETIRLYSHEYKDFNGYNYSRKMARIVLWKKFGWNTHNIDEINGIRFLTTLDIREDTVINDYEEKKYLINLDKPLLAINNLLLTNRSDVSDTIEMIENTECGIVRRLDTLKLDNTNNWEVTDVIMNDTCIRFKLNLNEVVNNMALPTTNSKAVRMLCSTFPVYNYTVAEVLSNLPGIYIDTNGYLYLRIYKYLLKAATLKEFKNYLATNPIYIIYERKTYDILKMNDEINYDTFNSGLFVTTNTNIRYSLYINGQFNIFENLYNNTTRMDKITEQVYSLSNMLSSIGSETKKIVDETAELEKLIGGGSNEQI